MLTIEPWTAAWFLPPLIPIAIWVAWSDLSSMKIPNKAVLAALIVFVVIGPFALPFEEYLWRFTHFAAILALGFVLTAIGLFGAGDSKFMSAMAPFIALADAYTFLFLLLPTILGAFAVHRLAKRVPWLRERTQGWESWERRDFPMGFALAPSLIFYLLLGLFNG